MVLNRSFALIVVAAAAAWAQDKPERLEFEVASVKPSAPMNAQQVHIGVHVDGSQLSANYLSLRDYIRTAYQVKDTQIVAPDWMAGEHYDINAKMPPGTATGTGQIPKMLQALLADRFKLVFHRETREVPVYALVVAKGGPKLKETPPDPETDGDGPGRGAVNVNVDAGRGGTVVNLGKGSSLSFGFLKLEGKKVPIPALVDSLGRFVDRPVVDMTELKGNYDFTLEYSMEELKALIRASGSPVPPLPENDQAVSIMTSLQSLGLKMEPRKAPLEMLIVDKAEKTPTEN